MMGGYSFEEDCEFILPRTVVLVGKTGNGKSATGNTILGTQLFQSKRSSSAVTTTCELKTTVLEDGQTLNVIDTPGLFDSSVDIESIGKEIANCINMVNGGIHAFLVVISVRSRFSDDGKAAINRLLNLFGRRMYDYMIIVFTGGDELEDDNESLEDFLHDSPKALQETLHLCGNRCVLFDNKTKDSTKRSNQVRKLLSHVNLVSKNNGGKPYANEIFTEAKVESKLNETTLRLEQQLAEERTARLQAEENAKTAQKKSDKKKQKKKTTELDQKEILEQFKRIFDVACYVIGREVESKMKETSLKVKNTLAEENAKVAQKKLHEETKKVESELKEKTLKLEELLAEERDARLMTEKEILKVELKLKETTRKLEQLFMEERTARLKAEENAQIFKKKSDEDIHKVEMKLSEITLKLEQLLADHKSTAQLQTEECTKSAQKNLEEEHFQSDLSVDRLVGLIFYYREVATSSDPSYQHIGLSEKFKILTVCLEAENWLKEKKQLQDSLPIDAYPVLLPSDISKKAMALDGECRLIIFRNRKQSHQKQ